MTHKQLFTLIELFLVISILAILATMIRPTLKSAIETAHLTQCSTNYKQLHLAFDSYLQDYVNYPINNSNKDGTDRGSFTWDDHLALGYDGRNIPLKISNKYRPPVDQLGTKAQLLIYQCPTAIELREVSERHHRTYSYNTNRWWGAREGFSNYWDRGLRWSANMYEVPKPERTFLLVENNQGFISGAGTAGLGGPNSQVPETSPHRVQYNYLFADGHSETFFPEETGNHNSYWTRNPND